MKESNIQKQIVSFLEWHKCIVYRMNSGIVQDARSLAWIHMHPAGTPDLLVGLPSPHGYIMAHIETKRSRGGVLNDDQIRELRKIHERGGRWLVADCYEDVVKWWDDFAYHGKDKYTEHVLDTTKKFVLPPHQKNAKMRLSTVYAFEKFKRQE